MATNHGSIEFLKFPNPSYPGDASQMIKKWLRDSWARRKIVALQQAVAAIVVPTASTATPQMDGTAAPGVSTDYARADHVHPHDSTKADVSAIPTKTSDLTNDSGYITDAGVTSFNGSTGAVTYTAPVTSVNGNTGAVTLDASDVGALPDSTTIPSKTSDLTNDSGFITISALQPSGYTTPNPYNSRCTVDAGGYVKVGKIVFIDMVITALSAAGTSSFLTILSDTSAIVPLKGANYTVLTAVNNTSRTKTTKAIVNTNGGILLCNAAANDVIYITGCYLAST